MKINNKIVWALALYLACLFVWYLWSSPVDIKNSRFLKELERLERGLDSLKKKKAELDSMQHIPTDSFKVYTTKPNRDEWLSK